MAGPVKDREAFQRLSFLYQVSPRLVTYGEAVGCSWPRSNGFLPPGRPLCPCTGPHEPGAGEVLLLHGEDHCKAAGLAAVRRSGNLAAGGTREKWERERGPSDHHPTPSAGTPR